MSLIDLIVIKAQRFWPLILVFLRFSSIVREGILIVQFFYNRNFYRKYPGPSGLKKRKVFKRN